MAADVTSPGGGATAESAPAPVLPAVEVRPHKLRFGLIYGALGAILVAAIVGLVVFATRSINPSPTWSTWKPSGGGQGAAQQIADHVAQSYHLPNGDQIVDVISGAPSIAPAKTTLPIHFIAVSGTKTAKGSINAVSPTNTVMYTLCGLGVSCTIATGTPSKERGELVRREILELSLYTFKYVGGVQNVIAFVPPAGAKKPKFVVYLNRNDLAAQLKQPLDETLGKKVPLPATIPAREVQVIEQTTTPRLYQFSGVAQSQQGDLIFVLARIPPAP
jgi:hypothetical protein